MSDELLARFERLRIWARGDERAPHKPLFILYALGEWSQGLTSVNFSQAEDGLKRLLQRFGPDREVDHPEYAFWRLQNDGVWEIIDADGFPVGQDGTPSRRSLLEANAIGRFPADIRAALTTNPMFAVEIARLLLRTYFDASLHNELLAAVALKVGKTGQSSELATDR